LETRVHVETFLRVHEVDDFTAMISRRIARRFEATAGKRA